MAEEKEGFIRFLLNKQLVSEKGGVWLQLFRNIITLVMVSTFVALVLNESKVPQEFNILVGLTLGYYFSNKSNKNNEP